MQSAYCVFFVLSMLPVIQTGIIISRFTRSLSANLRLRARKGIGMRRIVIAVIVSLLCGFAVGTLAIFAYAADPTTTEPKMNAFGTEISATSPDGEFELISMWPRQMPSRYMVARDYDHRNGEKIMGGRVVLLHNKTTNTSVELAVKDVLGQEAKVWVHKEYVESIVPKGYGHLASPVFSPNGKMVAAYDFQFEGDDKSIFIWSVPDGTLRNVIKPNEHSIGMVRFSPNSKMLATGNAVYDIASGKRLFAWDRYGDRVIIEKRKPRQIQASVSSIAWAPDGGSIFIGGFRQTFNPDLNDFSDVDESMICTPCLKRFTLSTKRLTDVEMVQPQSKKWSGFTDVKFDDDSLVVTVKYEHTPMNPRKF